MGRKKDKEPQPRHVWKINPKTRVTPNEKVTPTVCPACKGSGILYGAYEADCSPADCPRCNGKGAFYKGEK